jgi:DNA-binding MarR family transcriptional regulator
MIAMQTKPLRERLLDGLERLAVVMRADNRKATSDAGINSAQEAILRLLLVRPAGLRMRALADHLAVSQPTVTDSVIALERKGLVRRQADPTDARAVIIKALSGAFPQPAAAIEPHAAAALGELTEVEQIGLLKILIKLIRSLQLQQAIPPQRLCVTCKYFRPYAHPNGDAPHHCAFVDTPFGDRALRLDCTEHEQAVPADIARNWEAFATASPHNEFRP